MCMYTYRVLTGVGASLVWSCDPLPKESSCRVVWSEPYPLKSPLPASMVADAPPKKKRRLEMLISAMKCSEETQDHFDMVECGHAFCLGVAMEEQLPGTTAVLVVHWQTMGEARSRELTQVQLTTKSGCSGELSIDEKCLSLWNGEILPHSLCPSPSSMPHPLFFTLPRKLALFQGLWLCLVMKNFTLKMSKTLYAS